MPAVDGQGLMGERQQIGHRVPRTGVLSVVSAMAMPSDVSGIGGGRYVRFGLLAKLARARFPAGRDGDIQLSLMVAREIASPAYPFDEDAAREWIERQTDSGPGTRRRKAGRSAPVARPEAARAAQAGPRPARRPGPHPACQRRPRHRESHRRRPPGDPPGVGHDLPAPLWPAIADEVRQLADRAPAPSG